MPVSISNFVFKVNGNKSLLLLVRINLSFSYASGGNRSQHRPAEQFQSEGE